MSDVYLFDPFVQSGEVGDGGVRVSRFDTDAEGRAAVVKAVPLDRDTGAEAIRRSDASVYMGELGVQTVAREGTDAGALVARTRASGTM